MTIRILPGFLDHAAQADCLTALRDAMRAAPLFTPRMPRTGKPFSVRMTNCGPLGWVADETGYRYQAHHPETGKPWPPIPEALIAIWRAVADCPVDPEAALVNLYRPGAKLGLHQDSDEETYDAPVVSLSLGDTAVFRIGGTERRAPTRSVRLASGDVVAFGGEHRLVFHGVDRTIPGTSGLLPEGGRINVTLRRVTPFG
jgi:alkylated DNA repair protein (DNA oxidative demethylase)